jgi:hypothetical protein
MDRSACLRDQAAVEHKEATIGFDSSASQVVNDKLIKAVRLALQATSSQRQSPACAVHNIFFETARHDDDDEQWALRLLCMTAEDYSVRWDVSLDGWSGNGSIEFSGYEIAQQCARWVEKGWSFNTDDPDDDPCAHDADDAPCTWNEGDPLIDQEDKCEEFFLLPLKGEIVRRVWAQEQDGKIFLHYLDIRRADRYELYEYVVQQEGNPALISHSGGLLERSTLELFVKAEALPVTASAPYFVDADRWLDAATKAGMEATESAYRPDFYAAS